MGCDWRPFPVFGSPAAEAGRCESPHKAVDGKDVCPGVGVASKFQDADGFDLPCGWSIGVNWCFGLRPLGRWSQSGPTSTDSPVAVEECKRK